MSSGEVIGDVADLQGNAATVPSAIKPAVISTDLSSGNEVLGSIHSDDIQTPEEYFGSGKQQLIAGLEGVAQGVAGPLAPAAERALGINPEDIRSREKYNPITHYGSEAVGFILPALLTDGASAELRGGLEAASVAGQVGKVGELASAGAEALGLGRVLGQGVKTGAEMAAFAASNELGKYVKEDPSQSLGSAAIDIGLSGILGGAGGVALGFGGQALDKLKNVTGIEKILTDFQTETAALKGRSVVMGGEEFEAIPGSEGSRSIGAKLARWINDNGAEALAKATGETVSGSIGAGLGALIGHPFAGAYLGERALAKALTGVALPFAEKAVDAAAARVTMDYMGQIIRGQEIMGRAVQALVSNASSDVIPKELMPSEDSRKKLEKSLLYTDNPQNMMNVGGKIGYYLPEHATMAAQTAATAVNYLQAIKPKVTETGSPLDKPLAPSQSEVEKYNRQLGIAQQPLMVLQHVKKGTLIPEDLTTINTIYPGLQRAMSGKIIEALITNKEMMEKLPYSAKVSLNQFLGGTDLDSSLSYSSMKAIMHAQTGAQAETQSSTHSVTRSRSGGASSQALRAAEKANSLYQTPLQARAAHRLK